MAAQKTRSVVKIKKGQRVILPSDAQIISVTEVDGAQAESLCDLPAPTPLVNYTFFFERRAEGEGSGSGHYIGIQAFNLGSNQITWNDPFPHQDYNLTQGFAKYLKDVPGVAAVYSCTDCAGSGCNNTITISIPASLDAPYFTLFADDGSSDYWLFRLEPIDPDNPLQVSRDECTNRI